MGAACLCVLIAVVGIEVYRSATGVVAGEIEPAPPEAPPGALDPTSTAVRLSDADWKEYLSLPVLAVGSKAPRLRVEDNRGDRRTLPVAGKPSVWAVLCGCRDCAMGGSRVWELQKKVGDEMETNIFVANTSEFVWSRMLGSFGGACRLVQDADGEYSRRLRAPGDQHSAKPMIWGIDPSGRVCYFGRPTRKQTEWVEELRESLKLPEADARHL